MNTPRRTFFAKVMFFASTATLIGGTTSALAQSTVAESDLQAIALGYRADSTKVDAKKYPNYAVSQSCSGCTLFQGNRDAATAPCAVFAGKSVNGKGWCSAWTKRV